MAPRITALDRSWIPRLSQFLVDGFAPDPKDYKAFADPDALDWKFFQPRGHWTMPRSLAVVDGGRLLAHAAACPTEIGVTGREEFGGIPAVHLTDWLATEEGPLGAMVMMKAFGSSSAQYTFGCTESARKVLLKIGYKEVLQAPLFHQVYSPQKLGCWKLLHGPGISLRSLALKAVDLAQAARTGLKQASAALDVRPVERFQSEPEQVLKQASYQALCTSRDSVLLNYYLSHPHRQFSGWLIEDAGALAGFAVTCWLEKNEIRVGRIVELFLSRPDENNWAAAWSHLAGELRRQGCDLVSAYGSTTWSAAGLKRAGFFRRGKTALLLRDAKNLVPQNLPWHLSHLEADLSII
jgi:hypothetical protein